MRVNSVCKSKGIIRRFVAATLALFGALAASACSVGGDAAPTPTPTPLILETTPAPTASPGGTLRLSMPTNANLTDPLSVTTEEMLMLFSLVFEGLISIDPAGNITPELAENWTCDESGRVWTFHLRPAARWQDGGQVTAADVIKSFDRIAALGSATYYSFVASRVESMAEGADGALTVTMKQAGYASLYSLDFPVMRGGAAASGAMPSGTGPYRFAYSSDERVRLEVNPNWWKQSPYIEVIEFYSRDSSDVAIASYAAGQLDMVFTSSLSVGRYREEGVTGVADIMTQNAEVMLVNYAHQALRDVLVRRAIASAIDRSKIITNVYMNRARAVDVPVAPDSWLYESKSKVYDYHADVALSLFAQAGWTDIDSDGYLEKDGRRDDEMTLRLLVNESSDTARRAAADLIASGLEAVGVHVEVITASYSLGDSASEYLTRLKSGDFDLALVGLNLGRDYDFRSYLSAAGMRNYGKYSNAAVETLASNMFSALTAGEMHAAASQLQMRFCEELPFIMLYFRLNSILYSSEIRGIEDVREPDVMRSVASWYMAVE